LGIGANHWHWHILSIREGGEAQWQLNLLAKGEGKCTNLGPETRSKKEGRKFWKEQKKGGQDGLTRVGSKKKNWIRK
jgi:hypothetical protein